MKLLIATTNLGKLREYRLLLKGRGFKVLNLPKKFTVLETGKNYKANAVIKALSYGKKFAVPVLADDTGLEIKALDNFPGIYSNRFAGGNFARARKEILKRLKNIADRRARFVCVIAVYWPTTGKIKTFTGTVSGTIALKSLGRVGFGYDPIFIYPGAKMKISHRARAVKKFLVYNQKQ